MQNPQGTPDRYYSGQDFLGSDEHSAALKFSAILNMLKACYHDIKTSRNNTWGEVQRNFENVNTKDTENLAATTKYEKSIKKLNRGNEALLHCKAAMGLFVDNVNEL